MLLQVFLKRMFPQDCVRDWSRVRSVLKVSHRIHPGWGPIRCQARFQKISYTSWQRWFRDRPVSKPWLQRNLFGTDLRSDRSPKDAVGKHPVRDGSEVRLDFGNFPETDLTSDRSPNDAVGKHPVRDGSEVRLDFGNFPETDLRSDWTLEIFPRRILPRLDLGFSWEQVPKTDPAKIGLGKISRDGSCPDWT